MSQSPAKPSSAHQTNASDNAPSESSGPWPSALADEQPAYSSNDLIPPWHAGDGSGQKGKNRLSVQLKPNDSLDDGKKRKTEHTGDSQLVLYLKGGERQNIQETKQMLSAQPQVDSNLREWKKGQTEVLPAHTRIAPVKFEGGRSAILYNSACSKCLDLYPTASCFVMADAQGNIPVLKSRDLVGT